MAEVRIEVVARDAASGTLNRVNGSLKGLKESAASASKSVSLLGNALTTAAGVAVASAISSISASLRSAADEGIEAAAAFERLTRSLESLTARELVNTGAATNMADALIAARPIAQDLTQWIERLAILSPFTQEGIDNTFKQAQAYGFTVDQAKRLTQALVDFASGAGRTIDEANLIALALGQVQARGRLAGEEIRQMVQRGIPVVQILAKELGKSTSEIQKMVEDGLIPAGVAIESITRTLEQDFGGAAERQANSLTGLLSSLADLKNIGLRELFTGILEPLQPLMVELVSTLSDPKVRESIREIGRAIGEDLAGAIRLARDLWNEFMDGFREGGLGGGIENLLRRLGEFLPILEVVAPAVGFFVDAAGTLATVIGNIIGPFVQWQDVLLAIGTVIAVAVAPAIGMLIVHAAPLLGVIAVLTGAFALLRNAWERDLFGIRTKVEEAAEKIKSAFAGMDLSVRGIFLGLVSFIVQQINTILSAVNGMIRALNSIEIPTVSILGRTFGGGKPFDIGEIGLLDENAIRTRAGRAFDAVAEELGKLARPASRAGAEGGRGFQFNFMTQAREGIVKTADLAKAQFGPNGPVVAEMGKGAKKAADLFRQAMGSLKSAIEGAIDLSIDVKEEDFLLRQFGLQGDAINEAGRRLEDIRVRALAQVKKSLGKLDPSEEHLLTPSPWIEFFPQLIGLDPAALAASATKLQQDIQKFLRPDLLNRDAVVQAVRENIQGIINRANFVKSIFEQLLQEGQFPPELIQQAIREQFGDPFLAVAQQILDPSGKAAFAGVQQAIGDQLGTAIQGAVAQTNLPQTLLSDAQTQFKLQEQQFITLGTQIWSAIDKGITAGLQQAGILGRLKEQIKGEILTEMQQQLAR